MPGQLWAEGSLCLMPCSLCSLPHESLEMVSVVSHPVILEINRSGEDCETSWNSLPLWFNFVCWERGVWSQGSGPLASALGQAASHHPCIWKSPPPLHPFAGIAHKLRLQRPSRRLPDTSGWALLGLHAQQSFRLSPSWALSQAQLFKMLSSKSRLD